MRQAKGTPEIALFGRMVADKPDWNVDAACQVAHALSVNTVTSEFDFFTAVDDLKRDSSGADMIGTIQFGSSTFYRYLVLDIDAYLANLADGGAVDHDLREAARISVGAFIHAAVRSLPSGKQNTFAAHNPPGYILGVVRADQPMSLANAFLNPVRPSNDFDLCDTAALRLDSYFGQLMSTYGAEHVADIITLAVNPNVTAHLKSSRPEHHVTSLDAFVGRALAAAFNGDA